MTRLEEYEVAKKALNLMYGASVSEQEMQRITLQKQELASAFADGVIQDIQANAGKMHILIANLETVMTPTRAKQIADASKLLTDVLKSWNDAANA